jgi:hypothetical protein
MEFIMLDFNKLLLDCSILIVAFTAIVFYVGMAKPRLFLNKDDVPPDILAVVPPRTETEQRQAIWLSIPLFIILIGGMLYSTFTFGQQSGAGFWPLFLHAFIVVFSISTFDLIFIDWLVLNTITPKWAVYPGTEGFAGYKNYGFHGRAHLRVLPAQILGSAIAAGLVLLALNLL